MQNYLDIIEQVVSFFPLIVTIIALPYFYYQYKKNHTVELYRSIIMFTFVLYLIICYGLVILPLPTMEEIATITGPYIDLRLFGFIDDFLKYSIFSRDPDTWLVSLKSSLVYIPFFNLIMLIPFGVYQKTLFKNSLLKTVLFGFLLSLSFELIQLSSLFGIYPHPYRLFQLDDLILNTAGALIGWLLTPKRNLIISEQEKKQTPIAPSIKERMITFFLDIILLSILMRVIAFIFKRPTTLDSFFADYFLYLFAVILYFIIVPVFMEFKTPAGHLLDLTYTTRLGKKPRLQNLILRQLFLYGLIVPAPFIALSLISSDIPTVIRIPLIVILILISVIVLIQMLLKLVMTHEGLSSVYLTSDRRRKRMHQRNPSQDRPVSLSSSFQDHRPE